MTTTKGPAPTTSGSAREPSPTFESQLTGETCSCGAPARRTTAPTPGGVVLHQCDVCWFADGLSADEGLTTRDRRIIAEVLDRLIQRDIERRAIRETYHPSLLSIEAAKLSEFAAALRLDCDGDDVSLAEAAVDAVDGDTDGRLELRPRAVPRG
jgi:hypothetical protein